MKKFLFMAMIALAFVACGKKADNKAEAAKEGEKVEQKACCDANCPVKQVENILDEMLVAAQNGNKEALVELAPKFAEAVVTIDWQNVPEDVMGKLDEKVELIEATALEHGIDMNELFAE